MDSKKINVLMIDDHSSVRHGIRLMIDKTDDIKIAGEAENAEEGLRVLHKEIFEALLRKGS